MFLAFGVGASVTWYYHETIFRFLRAPAKGALSPFEGLPIFTSPTEMFGVTISLAMKGGMVAAFPVLVFSAYGLVSPLLNPKQRRFAVLFLPAIFLCYLGGAAFAYFVMLPAGLNFLLHFGTNIAVPVITITEYMSLVTALLFWLGVVFEIPLIMFLLAKLKLVSRKRFKKFRKYVPVSALILSAIITPTFDVVNQTLVAVPIVVLFEAGLLLAWLAELGHKEERKEVTKLVLPFILALAATTGVGLIEVSWHHDMAPIGSILCNRFWCVEAEQGIHLGTVVILATTWTLAVVLARRQRK